MINPLVIYTELLTGSCPANLDCPLVFFDQLIQEAERRRQEGDLEFVRMAAKVIGIDC